jgi:flagellar hook protein FlgE
MTILNASVSGMSADQNWLSSISQNVANSNTTGYKNVETEFSTLVDQVSNVASDGGGVQTSAISLNTLQGNIVTSQTTTNLAVQGSGFFVVSNAAGETYLTRNGSFVPDASGNLVNSAGYYLMGSAVQNGQPSSTVNSLSSLEKVNVDSAGLTANATTTGSLTANLPSSSTPTTFSAPTSTTAATCTQQTSLVVYDGLGDAHTVDFYFTKTGSEGDGTWEVDAYEGTTALANSQTLTFNTSTGAVTSGSPLTFTVGGQSINLDLSNMTQLASGFSVSAATANGNAPESVQGVSIGADGTLSFTYSGGASVAAYDIPLANVASPDNLASVNGNAYTATAASGPIFLGSANSGGFGAIESSSLESSTVDIATELTDMIQAQSAYEANSKVFQTGANILDVLNNLKP